MIRNFPEPSAGGQMLYQWATVRKDLRGKLLRLRLLDTYAKHRWNIGLVQFSSSYHVRKLQVSMPLEFYSLIIRFLRKMTELSIYLAESMTCCLALEYWLSRSESAVTSFKFPNHALGISAAWQKNRHRFSSGWILRLYGSRILALVLVSYFETRYIQWNVWMKSMLKSSAADGKSEIVKFE